MKKLLVLLAVVLVSIGVLAVIVRSNRNARSISGSKSGSAIKPPRRGYYVPPKDPGKPATPDVAAKAHSEAILKSTYHDFRSAVATGNSRLQDVLRTSLSKDLTKAIAWAEEDMARSKKPADLDIARKTLDSLRR